MHPKLVEELYQFFRDQVDANPEDEQAVEIFNRLKAEIPQPEDKWEPAMGPDDKVMLTLTGVDIMNLRKALTTHRQDCSYKMRHCSPELANEYEHEAQKSYNLQVWLAAVLNKGAADAGASLADYEGN